MRSNQRRHNDRRRAAVVLAVVLVGLMTFVPEALAHVTVAASKPKGPPQDLNAVIGNITAWLVGLLVALATLFLTVGGLRYLLAGGDPGEVSRAKDTLKYAAIGYGTAVLAPVLVKILQGFVGG